MESRDTRSNDLHWICGNLLIDPKTKFNLAEFYKAGIISSTEDPLHSCVDEGPGRLSFEIKGPYVYHLYTPLENEPKCLALDLFFKEPATISKIRFQNHYIAYLSLLVKVVGHRDWQPSIQNKHLMPAPHYETGSRTYFELKPTTNLWKDVTEIRFILRQPSPCWKKFYIENISIYREEKTLSDNESNYLINLIKKTEEALKMEHHNERTSGSNIPFHIGTCGYEIDKLAKF